MSKIIIVDKNDNIIGYKERGTVHPQNDIVRVSFLWLTNSQDQILLAQRKWNKKYNPGKWGPAVGGTNEEGETYESNIYKEAEEEIGLTGHKFTKGEKFLLTEPNNRYSQLFLLKLDQDISDFTIQEEEVEQIKWFDRSELERELKENPDNFTPAVRLVFDKIST